MKNNLDKEETNNFLSIALVSMFLFIVCISFSYWLGERNYNKQELYLPKVHSLLETDLRSKDWKLYSAQEKKEYDYYFYHRNKDTVKVTVDNSWNYVEKVEIKLSYAENIYHNYLRSIEEQGFNHIYSDDSTKYFLMSPYEISLRYKDKFLYYSVYIIEE